MRKSQMSSALLIALTGAMVLILVGIVQGAMLGYGMMAASQKAGAAFDTAHPYNAAVHQRYIRYHEAAVLAEQRQRPAPGWAATECELQTFDLRDHARYSAMMATSAPWPISMFFTPKAAAATLPPPPRVTPACQLERATFAAKA